VLFVLFVSLVLLELFEGAQLDKINTVKKNKKSFSKFTILPACLQSLIFCYSNMSSSTHHLFFTSLTLLASCPVS